jgi:hypothetical protein
VKSKTLLFLLSSVLLVFVNLQLFVSLTATQGQTSSPTEQPTEELSPTPIPYAVPISPWVLVLLVFTFVGLAAVVISVLQRLRRSVAN